MAGEVDKINGRSVPYIQKGDHLTADRLNQPRRVINQMFGSGPPNQAKFNGVNPFRLRQFKVKELKVDYVECVTWDTEEEGETVTNIALPYLIRKSPFDSLTNNDAKTRKITEEKTLKYEYDAVEHFRRKAIDTADEESKEDQIIVPKYVEGDIIYACFGILGGTDVKDEDENPVEWLDVNFDGRYWARDADPPEEEE